MNDLLDWSSPADTDTEASLLGALIIRPDLIPSVSRVLSPEDFYSAAHRLVYESLGDLFNRGEPIDIPMVCAVMEAEGTLDRVGGKVAVLDLISSALIPETVERHAERLKDLATLRSIMEVSQEITRKAAGIPDDVGSFVAEALEEIRQARGERRNGHEATAPQVASDAMDYIEKAIRGEHEPGVSSGYKGIDHLTDGLVRGSFTVVAAATGGGKSAFVTNIMQSVSQGERVLMFSLEMSRWEIGLRMVGMLSGVSWLTIRSGQIPYRDQQRVMAAGEHMAGLEYSIFDGGTVTVADIRAEVAAHPDTSLVIVDYLQLLSTSRKYDSENAKLEEITRALKVLAKDLNIPVVACSQFNREKDKAGGKPQLSHLRGSGSIEQNADVIMLIYPDTDDTASMSTLGTRMVLEVAKNRNGPTGEVPLIFQKATTRFIQEGT